MGTPKRAAAVAMRKSQAAAIMMAAPTPGASTHGDHRLGEVSIWLMAALMRFS